MYGYPSISAPADATINLTMLGDEDVVIVRAELVLDDYELYVTTGSARRDPIDTPNAEIGVKLALGRALRSLGREVLKEGQAGVRAAEIKRKSQVEAAERAKAKKSDRIERAKEDRQFGSLYSYAKVNKYWD